MKNILVIVAVSLIGVLPSCNSKENDSDIKANVDKVLSSNVDYASVTSEVREGVAVLSGEVKDESVKSELHKDVADAKGVKSVQNNTTIAVAIVDTPVITGSDTLAALLPDALKDHPTVTGSVNDGVITLTGTIKKADLPILMQKLNALRPKRVDNKLTVN